MRRLTVLVADRDELVHLGLSMLLRAQEWTEQCLDARTLPDTIDAAARYQPDVTLLGPLHGTELTVEALTRIRAAAPRTRVLLIVSGTRRLAPGALAAAGAAGVIVRTWGCRQIAGAIQLAGTMEADAEPSIAELSQRESEVLSLIAGGATNGEIAEQLFLSPHTIKEHTSMIYRKLSVRNRAEAVRRAQVAGLLS